MIEEQKEEKLKFLKREDIKTMLKDLKSLRERAAQIERERIASLTIEKNEWGKDDPSELEQSGKIPSQPQEVKEGIIPKKIRKPAKYKKYFVRIAMAVVFSALTVLLAMSIKKRNERLDIPEEIEEKIIEEYIEIPEEIEEETNEPIEEPEVSIQELIKNNLISWGYKVPESPRDIDTIIIHSGYSSGENSYDIFKILEKYENYKVSPHYFIDRNGEIYLLIPNEYIAYHAGSGVMPDGTRKNVINEFSIGIELIYRIDETPSEAQYESLALLVDSLQKEYQIVSENILGRNEISPEETDPWNFSWETLNFYIEQLSSQE